MVRCVNGSRLTTRRLRLDPLQVSDADVMVDVLASEDLYEFTGDTPPTLDQLRRRYRAQVAGSGDASEVWHNWIVRHPIHGAIGYVQATVTEDGSDVAWLIGTAWQRQGFAREAGQWLCHWLTSRRFDPIHAHIHPDHVASQATARALGLTLTGDVDDDDGEQIWSTGTTSAPT